MSNTFLKIKGHAELLSTHSQTFWNPFVTLQSSIMFASHCMHFLAFIHFMSVSSLSFSDVLNSIHVISLHALRCIHSLNFYFIAFISLHSFRRIHSFDLHFISFTRRRPDWHSFHCIHFIIFISLYSFHCIHFIMFISSYFVISFASHCIHFIIFISLHSFHYFHFIVFISLFSFHCIHFIIFISLHLFISFANH